jgi:adenylate cyclase
VAGVSGWRQAVAELARPGRTDVPGRWLWRVGCLSVAAAVVACNLVGALAVVLIATAIVPQPPLRDAGHIQAQNLAVAAGYVVFAVVTGVVVGTRGLWRLRDWLINDAAPTVDDQRRVLRAPLRLFLVQVALWAAAAVLFAALDARYSAVLAGRVAAAIVLTGLSTAACAYLLTERIMRPAAARALAGGIPEPLAVPGAVSRVVLAWLLGTGVPVAGLVAIGLVELTGGRIDPGALGRDAAVLGGIALSVGLFCVVLAARAIADPIEEVRTGLAQVESGDFGIHLPVYDGSQLGRLQIGFNQMAAGLAERERIRHALGVYLDPDVAARIVEEGVRLEGEEVEVTVLFIDVRDFTAFAEARPAREVVAALNQLFDRVVPLVHAQGGLVDKFVGDGLLAVFGAPRRLHDHADRAIGAALAITEALRGSELQVGAELNSGTVVAGNVGGAGRFEFSVIGDVVNTAARVEAATRQTGDTILLTEDTRRLARQSSYQFTPRSDIRLKGKAATVRLYTPSQVTSSG